MGKTMAVHLNTAQLTKNDPKITYMSFDFTYSDGFGLPHYFATTVDWDKEQWSFFENSHLACITIDISIHDNKTKKLKNATAKDRENIKSFAKALARNDPLKKLCLMYTMASEMNVLLGMCLQIYLRC